MSQVEIGIDEIDEKTEPHNGEPITNIELSPNGKYLVSFSREDNSIVGWNVENISEDPEFHYFPLGYVRCMCVSNDKKLVYLTYDEIKMYDMNMTKKNYQEIKLDCNLSNIEHCFLNLKNELILLNKRNYVYIYSAQTKNNKLKCKRIYKIPKGFKLISMPEDDKLYLLSNNSICEWNLITRRGIKILNIDEEIKYYEKYDDFREYIEKNISISSNESNKELICLRYKDKIIIFSIKLEIPIISLDVNDDEQLRMLMKARALRPLLLPLFPSLFPLSSNVLNSKFWNSVIENCKEKYLSHSEQTNQIQEMFLSNNIRVTSKFAFEILDGDVWKIDLGEVLSNINSLFNTSDELNNGNHDEIIENLHIDNDNQLTIGTFNLSSHDMDIIHKLFEVKDDEEVKKDEKLKLTQNLIKWEISSYFSDNYKIRLQVFKKINGDSGWDLTCTRIENFKLPKKVQSSSIYKIGLLNDSDIIILTEIGLLIYHFNENNKSISLNYFYHMDLNKKMMEHYKEKFSKHILPLPNCNSFKICDGYASTIIDNKKLLLEYGIEILKDAIEDHKLELIDGIYKKCIIYFKENLRNTIFLSIIISTMPLLNKTYPEYITRYSLETSMIIDSPVYNIESLNDNLHLSSFQYLQIINLTQSILWEKYDETPSITFMNPYIKFVNYPKDYNWFFELIKPQPSPFVETISSDIYKTWNGESLINFKWNAYGKYYYAMIWIGFMSLLGCFTVAATTPPQDIDNDIQKRLLITSIVLGSIHMTFEIRQFFFDPIRWISDFWNLFDVIAFLLPIYTSVYWLQTNIRNIQLLSFTCLFLDIKFLLFFRVFESFGIYFAIIISVGKRIIYFLGVLLIIIISFAHALYILLSPEDNFSFNSYTNDNDTNNPWNIVPAYHQVFENGTFDPNPYMIQQPDGNTNMFVNFRTAIFAMYLFLTGDSSALTNWSYIDNPSLAIMIVLFSFLIVVYLMNLFIGLLNNAIEKDDNEVAYLIQKAEILAEIELFYLLPFQRRWKTWFPEVLYYYANVDMTREGVKEMKDKSDWNYWYTDEIRELKMDLLNKLNIQPVDEISLQKLLKEVQENSLRLEKIESNLINEL
ncbi:hypothetical protein GLOIN_2v1874127 [Rhizophagus clarus]|uniref:Ion transport domain-containing protein n=1 Tax=Rhizophagus clarus TaxID=94130 RepID=A0A8H3LPJ2_9GLOM|nr:hypothetical protein GLOIN_2v1874127 [Rhizophagus clarus]